MFHTKVMKILSQCTTMSWDKKKMEDNNLLLECWRCVTESSEGVDDNNEADGIDSPKHSEIQTHLNFVNKYVSKY